MSIEQEIKNYALENLDIDMIGIASIDRFAGSMPGRHPCDILPGCKSVIVFGVGLLDGAMEAKMRYAEDGRENVHGIYGTYGYINAPNFHLMWATYYLARFIEKKYKVVAVPATPGPMMNAAPLSQRHAAVAAGLGEFGWHSVVLTPEFGPRNRFCAVLTQMELEPDPMYSGPKLCDPTKCRICVEKCPTGAISQYEGKDCARVVDMGGKHYEYSYLNWNRCRVACHKLHTAVGGAQDLVPSLDATAEEIEIGLNNMPNSMKEQGLQHAPSWYCGMCITYCPVGHWKERFFDRGLSTGKHRFEGVQPSLNDKDGDYRLRVKEDNGKK